VRFNFGVDSEIVQYGERLHREEAFLFALNQYPMTVLNSFCGLQTYNENKQQSRT